LKYKQTSQDPNEVVDKGIFDKGIFDKESDEGFDEGTEKTEDAFKVVNDNPYKKKRKKKHDK
jgi:hypothetical protein